MGSGGRRRGGRGPEISEADRKADRPLWRNLAERAIRAADKGFPDSELGRLGCQAQVWRWPAALPEGALVCALAGEAHAYGRQSHPDICAALAPNLRSSAEIVLKLLDTLDTRGVTPQAKAVADEPPAWTRRADAGLGDDR